MHSPEDFWCRLRFLNHFRKMKHVGNKCNLSFTHSFLLFLETTPKTQALAKVTELLRYVYISLIFLWFFHSVLSRMT
jgi:hypothetical protein